ncbi:MAG: DUF3795 domain-containing protein [Actinobacteria bacterium]|nr:DUF3795 domain-containing protein [Actinomycetota bacterium]
MRKELIAVCGNNCRACPRYTATASGDLSELEHVASLWFEMGFRDSFVSIDEIKCRGCTPSSPCAHGVRQCADEKGLENCGHCPDYPCGLVIQMFEKAAGHEKLCMEQWGRHYPDFKDAFFNKKRNLDLIKERSDKDGS